MSVPIHNTFNASPVMECNSVASDSRGLKRRRIPSQYLIVARARETFFNQPWLWRISWLTFGLDKQWSGLMAESVAEAPDLIQHEKHSICLFSVAFPRFPNDTPCFFHIIRPWSRARCPRRVDLMCIVTDSWCFYGAHPVAFLPQCAHYPVKTHTHIYA